MWIIRIISNRTVFLWRQVKKSGKDALNAVVDSTLSRLNPVIMASLTTILGMVPLIPDPMFGGMAATIMGGLFAATLITIIVIPVFYAIFYGVKKNKN